MKKTAILAIAAFLVFAPSFVSAASLTDAQILKLRQTCKGTLCDTIPLTTEEKARAAAKSETVVAASSVPVAGAFAASATAAPERDIKQEIRDLKVTLKELKNQLKALEKEQKLLLRK